MIKRYKDFIKEGNVGMGSLYFTEYPHQYQTMDNPDDRGEEGNLEFQKKNSNFQAIQNALKTLIHNDALKTNPNITDQDVENALRKFFDLGDFKKEQIKKISDNCDNIEKCAKEIYDKYLKYVSINAGNDKVNDIEQDSIMESKSDNLKVGKTYKFENKNGEVVAKLIDIKNYSSTGMPTDYIFELISGKTTIRWKEYQGYKNVFPLPQFLIDRINIKEVTE